MVRDDTVAGIMKRLVESTASQVDWSKAREVLDVSSREEAVELLAAALAKAQAKLVEAHAAMALIVHMHSEQAIVTTDVLGMVVSITPEGADLLGWPNDRIIGLPIDMVLADKFNATLVSSAEMAAAESGPGVFSERAHVREDGSTFDAHHTLFALVGPGEYLKGFVRRIEDVTERKAQQAQIEELDTVIALLIG